jgi:signal transduction histidine kinase
MPVSPERYAPESAPGAVEAFLRTAETLSREILEREWTADDVAGLLEGPAGSDLPRGEGGTLLFRQAAHDPRLLMLPPRRAAEAVLRLLLLLSPATEASLWLDPIGPPVLSLGRQAPSRTVRSVARETLQGVAGSRERSICGVPVPRGAEVTAALVVRAKPSEAPQAAAMAGDAALALAPVVERDLLLTRRPAAEDEFDAASRLLHRIRLDLHDGVLQEVAWLRADVSLLGHQFAGALEPGQRERFSGRLGEIAAVLAGVEESLRDLTRSYEPRAVLSRQLPELLRDEVVRFERRTDVPCGLELEGDAESLTVSQRVAVFRIVQECLSNVREHAGATSVQIAVHVGSSRIEAEIRDDGAGFDVDGALNEAQRVGRLGLTGMRQRAAFLGGFLRIESKPGGPTRVALVLPVWAPLRGGPSG